MTVPSRSHAIRIPPSSREQRVPSFQTFAKNAPVSLRGALPPTPSVNARAARRSSSVYSRATRCWDDLPVWDDESPPPLPTLPFLGDKKFSESSPELSSPDVSPLTPDLQDILPPLSMPRTYQPVLPTSPPSLAPTSMRKRSSNMTTLSALLPRDAEDRIRAGLVCEDAQLSPSPPPMSPYMSEKFCVSSENSSGRTEHFSWEHTQSHQDALPTSATLLRPFDCPADDGPWRNNSIDRALSHMRLGSDVSTTSRPRSGDPYDQYLELDGQSLDSEDVLLSEYRNELTDEYKELAVAPAGHWQEGNNDSDAETTGHELKMVPAPLFWENRQKELYPHRAVYAQQKQPGLVDDKGAERSLPKKHKMKISLSKAPLQMILPTHYKRKSSNSDPGDSPTTAVLKKALALRRHNKKANPERHSTEGQPRLFHGKPIGKPLQDGLMPLQLPQIAYRDVEVKKPVLNLPLPVETKVKYARRSSTESSISSGSETPESPLEYTAPRDKDISSLGHPHSMSYRHAGRDSEPSHRHSRHLPATPGFANFIHKRSGEVDGHLTPRQSHARNKSNVSQRSGERRLESAFSPVDDDKKSLLRPAIFDKALDAMRERKRNQRRKDLKSQIKFVGQTDPEKIDRVGEEQQKQRRETFGEGWI